VRTRDLRTKPVAVPGIGADDRTFTVHISTDDGHRVVQVCGELDLVTRNQVNQACLAGGDVAVVVEMAETTFMNCCGYGGLVAARQELQEHGGSLTLRNQAGQPAQLLTLLSLLEAG
jgi:anti-anti-sigma factor